MPETLAPNERSRAYLSVALVDHHTLSVDEPVGRFGHILDLAIYQGRYFTDKAPGSSFMGAALYGAARLVSAAEHWTMQRLLHLMHWGLMVPITLVGFIILRRWMRSLDFIPPIVLLTSVAWVFGSAAFHYGRAFYGHQLVAVFFLAAVWLLTDQKFITSRIAH